MPEHAFLENPADRRRHSRRSVYRSAELVLRGAEKGVDCTVLDESFGGVQVELEKALELPEELMLKFSGMASQLVRRCWAKGNRAGYQYIEIVPAERRWITEGSPPAEALPEPACFVAFNDFIHISGNLLNLAHEPADWIYPAEHIHALLAELPQAGLQPAHVAAVPMEAPSPADTGKGT